MTEDRSPRGIARLVSVGNVIIDIVAHVPALPTSGTDVVAHASQLSPGGGFNTMVAAVRQGLPTAYAGAHGTGPFGDLARAGLGEAGIEILLAPTPGMDTGWDVAMVEANGERAFVTAFGAEVSLTAEQLAPLTLRPDDAVHVSGYGLLGRSDDRGLARWIAALGESHLVVFDPGPLVADIEPEVLSIVLARADWTSANEAEVVAMTGASDARSGAASLVGRARGVLVRRGPAGCLVRSVAGGVVDVPGFAVDAIDLTGAGDAHLGAFVAALADDFGPVDAARRANACAALAVTLRGPATSPTRAELDVFLA